MARVLGEHGVSTLHVAEHEAFSAYAPVAVARAVADVAERIKPAAVVAAGTERGNEVLAHVAAVHDVPMAANVVQVVQPDPLEVERQVVGGAVLERVRLDGQPAVASVAGHAVAPTPATEPTQTRVEQVTVELTPAGMLPTGVPYRTFKQRQ